MRAFKNKQPVTRKIYESHDKQKLKEAVCELNSR